MKKIILTLCTMAVLMFSITACGKPMESNEITPMRSTTFSLVYNESTGVLYISGSYVLVPYLSANGKYCRYVDGEIVEIAD